MKTNETNAGLLQQLVAARQRKAAAIAAGHWEAAAAYRDAERKLLDVAKSSAKNFHSNDTSEPALVHALQESRLLVAGLLFTSEDRAKHLPAVLWHLRVLKALKELFKALHSPVEYKLVHNELQYWLAEIKQWNILTKEAYTALYKEYTLVSFQPNRTMLYFLFSEATANNQEAIQAVERFVLLIIMGKRSHPNPISIQPTVNRCLQTFAEFEKEMIGWDELLFRLFRV